MDEVQKQMSSILSFKEIRDVVLVKTLISDFAVALKIPQRLLSQYWKQVEIAKEVDREAIFNRVFSSLPFYVAVTPLPKSKDFTQLHQLEGKKGDGLISLFMNTIARCHNVAAGRGVVSLFKMPFMDGAYVIHALDVSILDFPGGMYTMPSLKGGRMVIQAASNFVMHPVIKEQVEKSIGSM